ncbi:cation:proton antiporter [Nocardioides sp. Root1257]|uniref:cation:proton antiporter n=1 Tax=unclassified Nocardioides TaxID=2615069 RepID=UPI0006F453C8|nr:MULTISPECIES: sodium:proton antiporter [unclassified Nocardioides]KQW49297.1 cation:proton antiporter [Nocardioides sp. Root1257]KRC48471.1 cation:proton antiporter [Nocardioides sp. Root224]
MEIALIGVAAALCIAGVTAFASRLGVAAPLLLVVVGVVASLLPGVPEVDIDPEWVLIGVLPPLLYSASVSMPAMDFRRDFTTIGSLSVILVVISAVVVGFFLAAAVPGIELRTGIALGAIISPTDAVATTIVKRLGVSPRVVAVLQGESLLNDATALVLLRSAVAATAFSVWGVAWDFVLAVVVAVAIGLVVGRLNLVVRSKVGDTAVNTAISFAVPFVAYLPTEHLGASGLVAAVTAGLYTGQAAPRYLGPRHRLSEEQNWRTIELLLEGGVFLLMGLELESIVSDVNDTHGDLWAAVWIGAAATGLVIVIRALYVVPLMLGLRRRAERGQASREHLTTMQTQLDDGSLPVRSRPGRQPRNEQEAQRLEEHIVRRTEMMGTRIRRTLADVDYLAGAPLGWREGTVLVWAGMRGVVTLAAAQTLEDDTPQRSLLVLIAFVVAAGSLVVQGGTLPWLVSRLGLAQDPDPTANAAERHDLMTEMVVAAQAALEDPDLRRPDGTPYDAAVVERTRGAAAMRADDEEAQEGRVVSQQYRELRLVMIDAMRDSLLRARSDGTYSSETLEHALTVLDADQITTELLGR